MHKFLLGLCLLLTVSVTASRGQPSADAAGKHDPAAPNAIHFTARSRAKLAPASGQFEVVEQARTWDPVHTAVIVIDVWDKHWCEGANRRVAAMVGRMNQTVGALRDRGCLIVHAPSDTMASYAQAPQRKLAQAAPQAPTSAAFKWNYLDPAAEGKLPIDDSDGGCDCEPRCKEGIVWKGQHSGIKIAEQDVISDQGKEVYNVFEQRGIKNVVIFGVHTNMCVLGRSFGIRQLTRMGKNVVLVRDLTDTMYNPRMAPFVAHQRGTDLVVEHVEKYWCPTTLSAHLLGEPAPAPKIVFVDAEQEYDAKTTLPAFAKDEIESRFGWKPIIVHGDSATDIPGLEIFDDADLIVLYLRRRTLPEEQLSRFKKYFDAGKPVVALRTSSHAFQNWLEFDQAVLGGKYGNHHGNDGNTEITPAPEAASHPILRGVSPLPFSSKSSLYKSSPLAESAVPLLTGKWGDKPQEPVAWTNTHKGGRVFYTSLGHAEDFNTPQFRRLLLNGILWALDKPVPSSP